MGDRASIAVHDVGETPVYLYSHWDGESLLGTLAYALGSPQGRARWSDGSYLARIIFNFMTMDADPETGYGLMTVPAGDLQYPLINVYPHDGLVEYDNQPMSFDEFIHYMKVERDLKRVKYEEQSS